MADWASFSASGEKKSEWADFGGFETASTGPSSQSGPAQSGPAQPGPAQGTGTSGSQPAAQPSGSGLYNVAPPPSTMHRRTSSKGSHDRGQLLSNVNSQLQQYKQRMQLLHQQLIVGQQKMKEIQSQQPPQPQVVAQYQRKLQQGIQQYRQLEVAVKQLTQQSQQLQAGGQRAGQSPGPVQASAAPIASNTIPRSGSQSSGTGASMSGSQENVFAAFDEPPQTQSKVEAPLQATPAQTEPAAATEDDPFASFVEEDSKAKAQPSAEGVAMDMFGAPTAGGGFGTEPTALLPEPTPAPPPPAAAITAANVTNNEQTQKLTQKVSKLQDELSLAEREKLKIQQDHEALKRSNVDLERQVQEWQLALEESEERYTELQGKHRTELEGVRKAGHDTLAIIVEEYKEQSRLSMQQEQERSRSLLASSLQQEAGKWEALLQEKEVHLATALDEGQTKAMEKTEQAIQELQVTELLKVEEAIAENSKKQEKILQEALEAERESSRKAIASAMEEEHERTTELLAELKKSHAEELEAERERGLDAVKEAVKSERDQAQELIKEALRKEGDRFEGKLQSALDRVQDQAEQKLGEELRMADVRRQRSLASVELFLKSAMTQLQVLLGESLKDMPTGAATVQEPLAENDS